MRSLLVIALNDLRIILRQRGSLFNIVIVPIVVAFAVGFANGAGGGGGQTRLLVDLIDRDQSTMSQQFLDRLRAANPDILICPDDNTPEDACQIGDAPLDETYMDTRLRDQTSLALIDLPVGFEVNLNTGQDVSLIYRSNEDATAPGYILQAVQSAAQQIGGAVVAARVGTDIIADIATPEPELQQELFERARDIWAQNPIRVNFVQGAAIQSDTSNGFQQSIPGIATMYVMFAVFPAISAFLEERRGWTFQRLLVMPVTRIQVLGGKLLARFLLGMIQFAILFGFGFLIGTRYGNNPLGLLIVTVAYTLCVTALTLLVMTFIRSEGQGRAVALFLTLTLAPLGGAWWPLDIVPDWMRIVGHLSPIAWAMDSYHSLIFFGGGLRAIAVPVLVLVVAALVFFAVGVARFRYE